MLKNLYREFELFPGIYYFPEYDFVEKASNGNPVASDFYAEDKILHKKVEALVLIKESKPKEFVIIAAFPDLENIAIRWAGENAESMLKTAISLKLPSYPSNLGEKVFHLFTGHLEMNKSKEPITLTQRIISGKENKLRLLIAKLLWVYQGGQIDGNFYSEWKKRKK